MSDQAAAPPQWASDIHDVLDRIEGYLEGRDPDDVRVKFGARPNQVIPITWAESILTAWAETDPNTFGRYLQLAAVGTMPAVRGRKPKDGVNGQ